MEKLVIVIKVQAMRATFGSCRLPAALNDSQVGGGVRGVLYFDAAGRFSGNASSSHTINWSSLMMSMLWSSMSQCYSPRVFVQKEIGEKLQSESSERFSRTR
ncbi:uncharacterized protein LOC105357979 isoform X3 [Oryzias latipes]|uniref:uncharacterized protein LOC105357979 isoform X3 n=1 Tax=Oryzias latipes TaxID=8090 RepID=UPI000CE1E392|nr:uncharacterized protein LOC105357979 isoform X3 [Oryzias latipes]